MIAADLRPPPEQVRRPRRQCTSYCRYLTWETLRELKREAARKRGALARELDVAGLLLDRGDPIGERSLRRHVNEDLGYDWADI